jgi:hypothetical protein
VLASAHLGAGVDADFIEDFDVLGRAGGRSRNGCECLDRNTHLVSAGTEVTLKLIKQVSCGCCGSVLLFVML